MELLTGTLFIVGLVYMILVSQLTKWEDRRDNKRWWEDTPGSRPPRNRR